MVKRAVLVASVLALVGIALSFGGGSANAAKPACTPKQSCPPPTTTTTTAPPPGEVKCVVWLHGQGGAAQATQTSGGVKYVYPGGNDDDPNSKGSGRRWLYYDTMPDGGDAFSNAIGAVQSAITANGCTKVVIDGFSNGGGFAGKLLCRGETFGGSVVGFVVDDPVTDHAVEGCARSTGNVSMYWTGALDYAGAGFDCVANKWTCEGGSLIGSDAYAAEIGANKVESPQRRHKPYTWPPEILTWLDN